MLVHPTMVVEVAKLIRSFIIESARQTSSNKGRTSKQAKLDDHLKSPQFARTIEMIRNANSKLDDLQRKEEDYHKTTWNNRKKFIDEWRKTSENNQQKINDIMQHTTSEDSQDEDKKVVFLMKQKNRQALTAKRLIIIAVTFSIPYGNLS